MNRLHVVSVVVLIIFLFSLALIPITKADWIMYRSDASHSGVGTGSPALTSALFWKYASGNQVVSSPAVVGGVVYVGSGDNNVYALNATNGAKLWSYTTGNYVDSSPAVVGGVVYVGSFDGNVYALSAANGAKLWNYTTGGGVVSSPAVVNGVVYVGSGDGNVYALSAANGSKLWSYTTGDNVDSSPAVVGGVVYVGSGDNSVYALSAVNGSKLWSYATTGSIIDSSPAVVNGVVYVGSYDNNVYALSAANGSKLWSYTTGFFVDSSPAVVNGVVYVGSYDDSVYALDAVSGTKLWSYATDGGVVSSPAVVGGVVYVGSDDFSVYALDAVSGTKLWSYATGFFVDSSPAVVGGVVYVGSDDNNVYALGQSSTPGLDHFVFNNVNAQVAGTSFSVTITAVDASGNTVTSYSGSPSLTYSAGSIVPSSTTGGFSNGVWTGSVTISAAGSSVTITATDGSHTGTSNPFTVNPTISASAGANGAINPSGSVVVPFGGSQSFSITANIGYRIANVLVDGVSQGAVSSYTFTNVQSVHTISASFAINTVTTYVISASAGANGAINPGGNVSVNLGDTPTFTFTPANGYHVSGVLVDGFSVSPSNSYQFTPVSENHTISVNFAINTYNVTVAVGAHGSSNLASQIVNWNSKLNFSFVPDAGYYVSDVAVNGSSVGAVNFLNITVTGNTTVGVSFAINTYTITASAAANGTISPSGLVIVSYGSSQNFTITSAAGYHVADVLVDGASVGAVSFYTFTNVVAGHNISATFAINQYAITASAGAGGLVIPSGSVLVNYSSSQSFTITANAGYYIVDVLVNGSSVGAVTSYTFTNVQAAQAISATFALSPTPSPSPTATSTPVPTLSPTPIATLSPSPTPSPVLPSPSPSPSPTASSTASPTSSLAPSPTPTLLPTEQSTSSPSPISTSTASPQPTGIKIGIVEVAIAAVILIIVVIVAIVLVLRSKRGKS